MDARNIDNALSPTELAITRGFAEFVSSLSFTGSILILCAYARYPELRKFSFTLIACLAATDLVNQIFDFVGPTASELAEMEAGAPLTPRCWAQALGNGVFELASVLWTGCIAWTLYALVWQGMRGDRVQAMLPRMCALVFGLPLLLMLLPFLTFEPVYGPAGAWCSIRANFPALTFLCFYVPLWITMAFNAFVHVRTLRRLQTLTQSGLGGADGATVDKLGKVMERLKWCECVGEGGGGCVFFLRLQRHSSDAPPFFRALQIPSFSL